MEELLASHRKQNKDLQNQITGMKKQATKSSRKQVVAKCEQLQMDLKTKQEQEIAELNGAVDGVDADEVTPEQLLAQVSISEEESVPVVQQQQPKKRRNRQKEKLAKRDAEIAKMKEEARKEAAVQPNLQKIEQDAIDKICELNKVNQFDIKPDGHCLFASILDQLQTRHSEFLKIYPDYDIYKLRSVSCDYIREHKDDFIPYLFDETTMQIQDIDDYTKEMETTAKWGGEIEILALSKIFDCPISIMFSDRPQQKFNENGKLPELKLVYYKHSYSLGEHYNSLHDIIN
ncbi:similar to Saccharomyces cerevisiae YHL013C OTU2 Protein of unknown function that may interact with ribosomes, based on co-purification experiments [Maudiozyma saulgeensis]|uniref:OTU domain-containing protein n=1 Tax=Maudiozyma saulgeensis TaxID=1789683 RepID=A0A1X7R971_9SACH|nr:similar to Saccharomyces cerevisiae YHL013C OTU2 Protein of unknown function that may interact with ribosomes, based on co-purification experiments [Kazachstania saulgeensis]